MYFFESPPFKRKIIQCNCLTNTTRDRRSFLSSDKKNSWTDCRDVLASKLQNSHELFLKSYFKELMSLGHHHCPVLRYQQCQVIHFHLLASFKTQLNCHFRDEGQFWADLQQTFSGSWLCFCFVVSGLAMLLKVCHPLLHAEASAREKRTAAKPPQLFPVGSRGSLTWGRDSLPHHTSLSWHTDQTTCSQGGGCSRRVSTTGCSTTYPLSTSLFRIN